MAANIPCLKALFEKLFKMLGSEIITSGNSRLSHRGRSKLDSNPQGTVEEDAEAGTSRSETYLKQFNAMDESHQLHVIKNSEAGHVSTQYFSTDAPEQEVSWLHSKS